MHARDAPAPPTSRDGRTGTAPTRRVHTLAVVDSLTADDLRACAARIDAWHDAGLRDAAAARRATSSSGRSTRSRSSSARSSPTTSSSPARTRSTALRVDPADLRRACEVQARSHLLHLREGFLETGGRGDALAVLIVAIGAGASQRSLHERRAARRARRRDDAAVGGAARRAHARRAGGAVAEVVALVGAHGHPVGRRRRGSFPRYLDAVERLVALRRRLERRQ